MCPAQILAGCVTCVLCMSPSQVLIMCEIGLCPHCAYPYVLVICVMQNIDLGKLCEMVPS